MHNHESPKKPTLVEHGPQTDLAPAARAACEALIAALRELGAPDAVFVLLLAPNYGRSQTQLASNLPPEEAGAFLTMHVMHALKNAAPDGKAVH